MSQAARLQAAGLGLLGCSRGSGERDAPELMPRSLVCHQVCRRCDLLSPLHPPTRSPARRNSRHMAGWLLLLVLLQALEFAEATGGNQGLSHSQGSVQRYADELGKMTKSPSFTVAGFKLPMRCHHILSWEEIHRIHSCKLVGRATGSDPTQDSPIAFHRPRRGPGTCHLSRSCCP